MSYPESIQDKAEKAGALWREGDYKGARSIYQEIIDSISLPLDKAKILSNLAQVYEEEGDANGAISAANAAIKVVNENELYKSLEGSHLRGYLNGFINRLQKKGILESLPYDESIPIEMNFSIIDRLRAHLSIGVISGVLFATLSSYLKIPSIDISLFHEKIVVFSLAGFLFSIFFTSGLLKQTATAIMATTGRTLEKSGKPALNLLSIVAILYLFLIPSAFWGMAGELVFFVLTGLLSIVVFYGFMYRKHGRIIQKKP